jgi:hypothetical protein
VYHFEMRGRIPEYPDSDSPDRLINVIVRRKPDEEENEEEEEEEGNDKRPEDDDEEEEDDGYLVMCLRSVGHR